jgi:hypothetical protein
MPADSDSLGYEPYETDVSDAMIAAGAEVLLEWLPEGTQPPTFARRVAEEVFREMISTRRL